MGSSNTKPLRPSTARMLENFHMIWVDGSLDEKNDDFRYSITKLREAVNTIDTFTDIDECMNFINKIKEKRTFIISSGAFGQTIVPILHNKPQVNTIYIFGGNKARHEKWIQQWPKIKGVFTDIKPICEALKQAAFDYDHNSVSISFVQKTNELSNQNLDTLDQSFMYTQILKDILLTIDFEETHINEFLMYARQELADNTKELKNVDKIEKEYHFHPPIWWYTYDSFLYSMLNKALRTMEVDRIVKMGFFVRDLHNHIVKLHDEQYGEQKHLNSFTVYRGQGLSQADFDQLRSTQGGLLSFNNFLSTSENHDVSLRFARRTVSTSDLIGILFIMKIHASVQATPMANVKKVSYFQDEEEILFSMHSVFRIERVKQLDGNNRLWQVELTLTNDNDPQLHALTKAMQEETQGSTAWHRLGKLMIKLGQYNEAEKLYDILLRQTDNEREKADIYYQQGCIKYYQGKYTKAIIVYEQSLQLREQIHPLEHPDVAECYNDIGAVYYDMGDFPEALLHYEKALEIDRKTLSVNHPSLATSYSNIGGVYDNMGEYSKALSYYEQALEIRQKTLPANHPDLATSYNNIGVVYYNMGEYLKALANLERAIDIWKHSLPPDHPSIKNAKKNIEIVKRKL